MVRKLKRMVAMEAVTMITKEDILNKFWVVLVIKGDNKLWYNINTREYMVKSSDGILTFCGDNLDSALEIING